MTYSRSLVRYCKKYLWYELLMIAVAILWVMPFLYPILMSFKTTQEVYKAPLAWPTTFNLENYAIAWNRGNMGRALLNTALITVISVLVLLVCGSLCAYTISHKLTRRWNVVYLLFVVGIIVPYKLGLLPTYVVFNRMQLTGQYLGAILLFVGIQMPMAVFLYTGFTRTIPRTYEEAAQIDGANTRVVFVKVVFPLLSPITATVAIQTGLAIWNEFYMSLIFMGGSRRAPLSVLLYTYVGDNATQWNLVFASVVLSLIPTLLLYVFAQKKLIMGFAGGIKG